MTYETDIVRNPNRSGKGRGNRNGSLPRDYLHASGQDVVNNATRHALWRGIPSGGWMLVGVRPVNEWWMSPASAGYEETIALVPSGLAGWYVIEGMGPIASLVRLSAGRAHILKSLGLRSL